MSLDAFSVIVAFLAVLEVALGIVAVALGIREMRGAPATGDDRRPLLVLVGATLVVVALASLPLFYLLLASWVPRWPGVMCVEGVRRIGLGSIGIAGWLPHLVSAVDVTKLLVVFAAGAWAVLRRAGGTSGRRAAIAAVILGLAACIDGAVETAYVVIPKQEVPADAGCCMAETMEPSRVKGLTAAGAVETLDPRVVTALFLAGCLVLCLGAASARALASRRHGGIGLSVVVVMAAASLPLALTFLGDVAAPALLRLPFHQCVWCVFTEAPETIAGAGLYVLAVLCTGWALVANPDAKAPGPARTLLAVAAFGFLAAGVFAAVALQLA